MSSTRLYQKNNLCELLYDQLTFTEKNVTIEECYYTIKRRDIYVEMHYSINIKSMPKKLKRLYKVENIDLVMKITFDLYKNELRSFQRVNLCNFGTLYENIEISNSILDIVGCINTTLPNFINKYIVKIYTTSRLKSINRSLKVNSGKTIKDIIDHLAFSGTKISYKCDKEDLLYIPKNGKMFSLNLDLIDDEFKESPVIVETPVLIDKKCNIYVGCEKSSEYYKEYNIKCIISCLNKKNTNTNYNITHINLNMRDNISQSLISPLGKIIPILIYNVNNKINTLIHCKAGISRSTSLIIGWLMFSRKTSFDVAFDYTKNIHQITNPNIGFILDLKKYEDVIHTCFNKPLYMNYTLDMDLYPKKPPNIFIPKLYYIPNDEELEDDVCPPAPRPEYKMTETEEEMLCDIFEYNFGLSNISNK